jgi:cellulose biosynthesis protein BcsQ
MSTPLFSRAQRATGTIGRESIFENIFQPIEDHYDAILIRDGPMSMSLMQICAMVYTTDYVIPISMDALSVTGATAFFNTARDLFAGLAPPATRAGAADLEIRDRRPYILYAGMRRARCS